MLSILVKYGITKGAANSLTILICQSYGKGKCLCGACAIAGNCFADCQVSHFLAGNRLIIFISISERYRGSGRLLCIRFKNQLKAKVISSELIPGIRNLDITLDVIQRNAAAVCNCRTIVHRLQHIGGRRIGAIHVILDTADSVIGCGAVINRRGHRAVIAIQRETDAAAVQKVIGHLQNFGVILHEEEIRLIIIAILIGYLSEAPCLEIIQGIIAQITGGNIPVRHRRNDGIIGRDCALPLILAFLQGGRALAACTQHIIFLCYRQIIQRVHAVECANEVSIGAVSVSLQVNLVALPVLEGKRLLDKLRERVHLLECDVPGVVQRGISCQIFSFAGIAVKVGNDSWVNAAEGRYGKTDIVSVEALYIQRTGGLCLSGHKGIYLLPHITPAITKLVIHSRATRRRIGLSHRNPVDRIKLIILIVNRRAGLIDKLHLEIAGRQVQVLLHLCFHVLSQQITVDSNLAICVDLIGCDRIGKITIRILNRHSVFFAPSARSGGSTRYSHRCREAILHFTVIHGEGGRLIVCLCRGGFRYGILAQL